MSRPSLKAADNEFKSAHNKYREYVRRAVIDNGGATALARALAMPRETVEAIIRRDRISKLRDLARQISENGL